MQFIMEFATLLHIDCSQASEAIEENTVNHENTTLLHINPSQE